MNIWHNFDICSFFPWHHQVTHRRRFICIICKFIQKKNKKNKLQICHHSRMSSYGVCCFTSISTYFYVSSSTFIFLQYPPPVRELKSRISIIIQSFSVYYHMIFDYPSILIEKSIFRSRKTMLSEQSLNIWNGNNGPNWIIFLLLYFVLIKKRMSNKINI